MPHDPRDRRQRPRPTAAGRPPRGTGADARPGAARTDWGEVADWYDRLVGEGGSEYHREIVLPGVLRLLAPRAGHSVLDVACGQGVLCRLLAERGVHAVGIDASRELITAARQRAAAGRGAGAGTRPGTGSRAEAGEGAGTDAPEDARSAPLLKYHVGDARELDFLPAASFDAAACVLAIQNIHPIQPVFTGAARALKRGGKFVVVMMHPAFRGPKETSWGWDEAQKVQYRRVDRYLLPRKAPIVAHPGKRAGTYTWTFHKPIEAYVKAVRNAGLLVDALEEWPSHKTSTSGPRAAAENAAREEIPMFLALRAVRVDTNAPMADGRTGPASADDIGA